MDSTLSRNYELFPSPKRVRAVFNGEVIADSRRTILLRRDDGPPTYYFPLGDLRAGVLERGTGGDGPYGETQRYHVRLGDREGHDAAWSLPELAGLEDHIAFVWDAMDAWFEEDQEIFIHPRDPRKRIDIAASSAHVRVTFCGMIVAESRRPVILFETGLAPRYYLPKLDARLDLLLPSDLVTYCPYKGEARYHSIRVDGEVLKDVVWYYRYPTLEASPIGGLLCFYQEKLEVEVDGRRL